jgi:hypothetical protein
LYNSGFCSRLARLFPILKSELLIVVRDQGIYDRGPDLCSSLTLVTGGFPGSDSRTDGPEQENFRGTWGALIDPAKYQILRKRLRAMLTGGQVFQVRTNRGLAGGLVVWLNTRRPLPPCDFI